MVDPSESSPVTTAGKQLRIETQRHGKYKETSYGHAQMSDERWSVFSIYQDTVQNEVPSMLTLKHAVELFML